MAYIILAEPGSTKHAPCAKECQHIDCNKTKEQAKALCPFCNKPLGYNNRLASDSENSFSTALAHQVCLFDWNQESEGV